MATPVSLGMPAAPPPVLAPRRKTRQLDGGHIAGALFEGLRRGVARLRHRPDPGFVDVAKMLPVAYVVAGLLLVMSLVLIAGDIVAPVQLS